MNVSWKFRRTEISSDTSKCGMGGLSNCAQRSYWATAPAQKYFSSRASYLRLNIHATKAPAVKPTANVAAIDTTGCRWMR